jgi:hypothetical protein
MTARLGLYPCLPLWSIYGYNYINVIRCMTNELACFMARHNYMTIISNHISLTAIYMSNELNIYLIVVTPHCIFTMS